MKPTGKKFQITQAVAPMALILGVLGASCVGKHEKPNFVYMPDMMYSPAFKAQEDGAMRLPVSGTIPRGYQPYAYANDPEAAGRELKNPLARTMVNFKRGETMYNTYCLVCHGPMGEGDGTVVPKFPRPPSLQSDKVRGWSDGRMYHVIRAGQGLMPTYAKQVAESDRWAIVHYIRALQRSKNPTPADLKAAEQE